MMDIWGDKDSIEVRKGTVTHHFIAVLIYHVPLPFPMPPYSSLSFSSFYLPLISDRTRS